MPSIFDQMEHKLHPEHSQEITVTTPPPPPPAQPQRNVLADLSAVLGELSANSLISSLFANRLGSRLDGHEIENVIGLVTSIEANRAGQAVSSTPAWLPAPPAETAAPAAAS